MSPAEKEPADERELELAAERLTQILNDAALALAISLGHRAGLFEALTRCGPATSGALAREAGLQERYVREWLGAVTVGGLVTVQEPEPTYRLPPAMAELLTDAGPANLAAFMQYVPVLGSVEDDVLACFHAGGGVPYERYPRFQDVMEEDSAQTVLAALDEILALAPGLTERLRAGIEVLDVGCGRGRALAEMAERFPRSSFTGVDLSEQAVTEARRRTGGLLNVRYVAADAAELSRYHAPGSFDLITTFDAVHDQTRPRQVLGTIASLLRPDGVYLAQDIRSSGRHSGDLEHPLGPFLYTISLTHCMPVSLVGGGEGLGTMWGVPAARELMREAGFASVEVHRLPHDEQNAYFVARTEAGS